eukprot:3149486-Prymnesium_polylepis.1
MDIAPPRDVVRTWRGPMPNVGGCTWSLARVSTRFVTHAVRRGGSRPLSSHRRLLLRLWNVTTSSAGANDASETRLVMCSDAVGLERRLLMLLFEFRCVSAMDAGRAAPWSRLHTARVDLGTATLRLRLFLQCLVRLSAPTRAQENASRHASAPGCLFGAA